MTDKEKGAYKDPAQRSPSALAEQIRESETRYRDLISGLPVAVYTTNAAGEIELFNEALVKLWGFRPAAGKDMWWGLGKIYAPDGRRMALEECPMAIALKEGKTTTMELAFERPDGTRRSVISGPQILWDNEKKISSIVNALIDITPQVEARLKTNEAFEENLRESNERIRAILEYAPDAVVTIDHAGIIISWNPEAVALFGWVEAEVMGKALTETIIPERYREQHTRGINHFLKTGIGPVINKPIEISAVNKQQQEFPVELKISATKVKNSYIFIGFIRDIRIRKEAEQLIQHKSTQLAEAQQLAHVGSWEWNVATNEISWSDELYRIFGLEPREIAANYESYLEYIHPEDRDDVNSIVQKAFKDHAPFSFYHRTAITQGGPRVVSASGRVLTDSEGNITRMSGTAQDVTEQKRYEEELKAGEERFSKIFDRNPIPMTLSEIGTNKIRYANDIFCEAFGYAREEVIGFTSEELNLMGAEEYKRVIDVILNALKDSRSLEEIQALSAEETEELLIALRQSDAMKDFEIMYTRKNGETFPALVSFEVIRVGAQKFTVASYHDISERKKAEELLREQNIKLEKINRELNSFAYISSHDLQEPLRKIQTFSEMLMDRESDSLSAKGKELLERMQNTAGRMRTLIDDLLAYSRMTEKTGGFEQTSLNREVDRVKEELAEELVENNGLMERNEMGEAFIIPFQFRQLLHNLTSNSLKFARPGVPPHIRIESYYLADGSATHTFLEKRAYTHIRFTDNGIGFDAAYKNKIFEIFQRLHTREGYRGTGIGLAIVKKIVDNHDGHIIASGEPGKGASFDIYLPGRE